MSVQLAPLAERHANRLQRKAMAVMEARGDLTRGNEHGEDGPFVLGDEADGFDRAGIGVVNTNFATTSDPAKVVDRKSQIDPVAPGDAGEATAAAAETLAARDAEQAASAGDAPANPDSPLAWGSTTKGAPEGMPKGSKAQARADAAADKPAE